MFFKWAKSQRRIIAALALVAIIVPTFALVKFWPEYGPLIGSACFAIFWALAVFEVLNNMSLFLHTKIITALIPAAAFYLPWDNFIWIVEGTFLSADNPLSEGFSLAFGWKTMLFIFITSFFPILTDRRLWALKGKAFAYQAVILVTLILGFLTLKALFIINIVSFWYLFFFIPLAIVSDTSAYYGGKYLGKYFWKRKKLAPKFSPKKTWAGLIVSLIVTTAFVWLLGYVWNIFDVFNNPILVAIVLSISIPLIAPLGDLFFSFIKRYLGIKDFSNIMPGHGGLFDRIDSLSFVIGFFVLFYLFVP